nr:peptidyl-prolyl cis-trans isomerase Pin1-like [Arachis hypogaea]
MSSCSNSHGGDGGEVRASHILVKHQGSRRKASWKDPKGQVIRNTTRDSVVFQLKAFRDDIVSVKAKFEDIASRFSDCSSANRAGDLGHSQFGLQNTSNTARGWEPS